MPISHTLDVLNSCNYFMIVIEREQSLLAAFDAQNPNSQGSQQVAHIPLVYDSVNESVPSNTQDLIVGEDDYKGKALPLENL
ncbi:hypothetical protein KIN20_022554 [Parelaphostrongylus tenuis]|uniref:Uncharacterized protein n=1 Tax=Parelaphostrongylus tenuis TaxID=148309 RepID=A0AAD5N946_PARTN|nr:hypothetical protein KIN20_022554 [Parelaphostrongylus tenuis]